MKKIFLLLVATLLINLTFADKLILINYKGLKEFNTLHANQSLKIHYSTDDFIIGSAEDNYQGNYTLLDENCWSENQNYYISWFHKGIKGDYASQVSYLAETLAETDNYLILTTYTDIKIHPPIDGRIIKIYHKEINLPEKNFTYSKGSFRLDPTIEEMMEEVDTNIFLSNLQHLQDYGTRNAYSPEAVEAQNWIKNQFESYGYEVELFDFTMPNGPASDNVLATKIGTKYPDEYVVIGGHYDSYSWSGTAPGADDNGTGTCGVMEVARVMSDFETDRTVIFCAWSGEEYGLYGSEAYAEWAAGEGLNILGYFNIDMCGYRHPGNPILTDIIAPSSAQPLVEFYMNVCALYLPDFIVGMGSLSGGDSDHTSFNNNGYMGIFPFEDAQNYSPYIHTSDDVIGLSVNSLEMCMIFTQAMVANVATMANWLAPPSNLIAIPGDGQVELNWDPLQDIDYYNVYKDNVLLGSTTDEFYVDEDVENYTTYTYYVTALYTETGEESNPSNVVMVTPLPPMNFPFIDDFETGAFYWNFEGTWGLSSIQSHSPSHSLTESPTGNYGNNIEISATLYGFSLEYAEEASLSFWTKYSLETNYDYTYLQISTNGINWTTLETFNGNQNSWIQKTYSLDAYLGESYVLLRFKFESDGYLTEDGMYIDDFELNVASPTSQEIELNTGFQFISSNRSPQNPDMLVVLENNLNDNLDFVRDSEGTMVRKIGPNWVNGIGDWISVEGYLFKMNEADILIVSGAAVNPQTSIVLTTGFQFVSYLPNETLNALDAFNNILTDNLDFIRNSGGSVLRKIGPNWVNGLGDVYPGEGYLIKMFSDDILIYNIPENTKNLSNEKPLPVYFNFEGGNPADPVYTLYISGLEIGDEVAAFDGEKIIGAAKISSNYVFDNELPVFSTLTDSEGYGEGNPIILKVWSSVSKDIENVKIAMENNYNAYEGNVYPTGDGQFSIVNITKSTVEENSIIIYPNPAENVINISSPNKIKNVTIYNYVGQTVYSGNSIRINTANFDAGVYIIRIETNDGSTTEKLTIK